MNDRSTTSSHGEVSLSGRLICADDQQVAVVARYLPRHIELTRAEPGCISFSVVQSQDPRIWRVEELFANAAAFESHQQRVADSEWGRVTSGIERDYTVRTAD
ncbi:quinol monooxygenase YgiN [Gordonia amarae]|uniref:putative quinol monooxygenase n=1 Tax=Gordonia amarae TaxID=36821 RepID=UPI000682C985|nr:antibiotic biosynthesis monooxygenase [Gordonia amarae]MCS3880052.1 quinol monooxygenase YgiN [Gordonia amarae]